MDLLKKDRTRIQRSKAEERKRKERFRKVVRMTVQIFFFFLMPGAFVAGFAGVKYLFTCLNQGSVIEYNGFLKSLVGLALFTMLFGRFFCGYVCAFGTTGDLLHSFSRFVQKKVFKRKKVFRIPDRAAALLQKLKYLNLFAIAAMCTFGIYAELSGTSIWDVFSRLVRGQTIPKGYSIGLLLLILTAVGMLMEERFFCQFFCPMGAVFALLPLMPFSMLRRQEKSCGKNCGVCQSNCPAHMKLRSDSNGSGECISCGKCRLTCPRGNISAPLDGILRKDWVAVLIKTLLFFLLGTALGF